MTDPKVVITEALGRALASSGLMPESGVPDFDVSHPKVEAHGDYSTNLAMAMFSNNQLPITNKQYKSPREVAEKLITSLQNDAELSTLVDTTKLQVAGAGFINFWLKEEYLLTQIQAAKRGGYGRNARLKGKQVMVEYTDPNPFKEMHIGHLMSNTIGEAIARLVEAQGAEVERACYQGDVGLHVAKAVWGMQQKMQVESIKLQEIAGWDLNKRQKFMGEAYAMGATKYEEDPTSSRRGGTSLGARAEMITLNKQIYERSDEAINALYDVGRTWSLEYFETIYARLGTKFDQYFFESEAGPVGLAVVEEGLAKGILEIGEGGAVVYRGEKEGLHTRVFRNKLGLPTYEAKDLGLAKTKYERVKYDLSYIVTANEITEYFKVVLSVMRQLYPELADKTTHLPHGVMKLTTGKMSSRTGKVVTAEGLLDDLKAVVLGKIGERAVAAKELVADQVAVGALKYTVLRQAIGGDIIYEPDKMTNLEGATGPYVQYAYSRASSILNKFEIRNKKSETVSSFELQISSLQTEELSLLRWLYRYPEVIEAAGRTLSPHMLVTYVTELAARFNTFYQACRVVDPPSPEASVGAGDGVVNGFRYELVEAVANVLASGLNTLGITAPTEM